MFNEVVVINDAERLSKDAQHALRRTMEKYSSNIRFILCCSSVGRVISPIRSRCLLVRLSSPKDNEVSDLFIYFSYIFKILGIIRKVANAESYKCGDDQLNCIIKLADGNVRKAILLLESSSVKYTVDNNFKFLIYCFSPSSIQKDWTVTLKTVSSLIAKEQNPNTLLSIRATFYDLLNHCIPASLILKNLSLHILESSDPSLAPELCSIFAEYVIIKKPNFIFIFVGSSSL